MNNQIISTEGIKISNDNNGFNKIIIPNKKHFIQYFLELKANKSIYTAKSYEKDIKDFFNVDDITMITIDDIINVTIFDAQNFILQLTNSGRSSATINRKISSLSSLYKWLLKYKDNSTGFQLIKYNPFSNLKEEKPTVNNDETEFLTKDECVKLLNSIDISTKIGLRNKTILSLAFTTALRKSEIINIKISDITTYNNYNVIKVIRKGNKNDIVKLQPSVEKLINEYILITNRDKITNRNEYLFIGHSSNGLNGKKLNPNALNLMIKKVCKEAGINKKLRVHSTRHTAITLAITEGASAEKVRDFAAHKNLATTNRYIHSIDKLKNNAGDFIDIL